jgi:MFS family permease
MRSPATRRLYHGWRVVAAAFLIALFGWGLGFYGPGIYLVALEERHGWPGAEISFAITTYYLAGATLILFGGAAFERLGAPCVVMAGAVAMAAGVALLTLIGRPWQVYAAFAVMSLGWAAMSGAAINIIVAPWFERRRGLAVSLALNGASAGGVVIAPLIILLISQLGFSAALWCGAALMLAVVLPAAGLVLRPRRADEHDRADLSTSEPSCAPEEAACGNGASWRPAMVLHDGRFLTIAIPFALGLTAQVGFLTHQVAYLSPLLGTVAAGWAVSLTTFAAVVGRVAMGAVVDRVDRRTAARANFLVQVIALGILIAASSPPILYLGCALFGLAVGNMISLPGLIVQQEFPNGDFARVVSAVVAINQFTFAFGPALLGALRQAEGSYTAPLAVCLATQALAATLVMVPRLRVARQR